jgi:transcriptional regulator with XRE-family HTH domain
LTLPFADAYDRGSPSDEGGGQVEEATPHPWRRTVAHNLRRARELRGLTQAEVVERLAEHGMEISEGSLSNAESGAHDLARARAIDPDELAAFSSALEVPLAFWFLPHESDNSSLVFPSGSAVEVLAAAAEERGHGHAMRRFRDALSDAISMLDAMAIVRTASKEEVDR